MTFLPLRRVGTRLTLWYVCLLAAVLAFSWGLTMFLLYWQSINQMDRYAIQDAETVEGLLYLEPGGNIGLHEDYHNHPESKLVLERLLEVRSEDGRILYQKRSLGRSGAWRRDPTRRRRWRIFAPNRTFERWNGSADCQPQAHSARSAHSASCRL